MLYEVITIDLAVGDDVTCTFTNTKRGAITVVKDAMPDGPQDFDFTLSGPQTSASFRLDDDGDETDNRITSYNVCYTKLLRLMEDPALSGVHEPFTTKFVPERLGNICLQAFDALRQAA